MKKTYLVIAGLAIAGTMLASTPARAQPIDMNVSMTVRRFSRLLFAVTGASFAPWRRPPSNSAR